MLHHENIDAFRAKYNDVAYLLFRVFIGALFMFHGLQKVFGLFTDKGALPLMGTGPMSVAGINLMYIAGLIEFLGGLFIAIGLFTSISALLSLLVMGVAFFMSHFTISNPIPIVNRGELALVYLFCFLYLLFEGGGKYSLDAKICHKCDKK